jgi:hypothetical protein
LLRLLLVLRLLVLLRLLLVLLLRLCLGARLPVKAQAGRKLVALAALAPILDIMHIHYRFQFFMPG